jgi:hypothetical protein
MEIEKLEAKRLHSEEKHENGKTMNKQCNQ